MIGEVLGMEGKVAEQMLRLRTLQVESLPVEAPTQPTWPPLYLMLGYQFKPLWMISLENALGLPPL